MWRTITVGLLAACVATPHASVRATSEDDPPVRRDPPSSQTAAPRPVVYRGGDLVAMYEQAWETTLRLREAERLASEAHDRRLAAVARAETTAAGTARRLEAGRAQLAAAKSEQDEVLAVVRARAAAGYALGPGTPPPPAGAASQPESLHDDRIEHLFLDVVSATDETALARTRDRLAAARLSVIDASSANRAASGELRRAREELQTASDELEVWSSARQQAETTLADAASALAAATPEPEVAPDGCPINAPAMTLTGGSAAIGVFELCQRSIAQAPNAWAATAVQFALSQLGSPYSPTGRMRPGVFDCSSLVMRAYEAAGLPVVSKAGVGWAPTTWVIREASWVTVIDPADALPGDLVFSSPGHVAMVLADGFMVHTNEPDKPARVQLAYREPFVVVRLNADQLANPDAVFDNPWDGGWVPARDSYEFDAAAGDLATWLPPPPLPPRRAVAAR